MCLQLSQPAVGRSGIPSARKEAPLKLYRKMRVGLGRWVSMGRERQIKNQAGSGGVRQTASSCTDESSRRVTKRKRGKQEL